MATLRTRPPVRRPIGAAVRPPSLAPRPDDDDDSDDAPLSSSRPAAGVAPRPPAAAAGPRLPRAWRREVPARGAAPELGVVLLLLGGIAWLGGARFTVDGMVQGLNWLLVWFGVPITIPMLTGWWLIAAAVAVGLICSRVEIVRFPFRLVSGTLVFLGVGALVGWVLVSIIDLSTTFVGLTGAAPDAWALHRWVAARAWVAGVSTAALTFGPELAMIAGWHFLGWGRRPRL